MKNIRYQSDSKIISIIAHEQVKGWEYLYDKYNLFLHLNEDRAILIKQTFSLCPFLMQDTFTFVRNELIRKDLEPDTSALGNSPKLIQLLCAKYCVGRGSVIGAADEICYNKH